MDAIVLLEVLARLRERWDLCRQTADNFGDRPADPMRLKAQHGVVRIAFRLAVTTAPARPPISHAADRRDHIGLEQPTVTHRHAARWASRPRDFLVRHLSPEVEQVPSDFDEPLTQLHLRLAEIDEVLRQCLDKLFQFRHDFLVQLL